MSATVDDIKKVIARAIGNLHESDFGAREKIYERVRRSVRGKIGSDEVDYQRLVEEAVRATETDVVAILSRDIRLLAWKASLISWLLAPAIGAIFLVVQFSQLPLLQYLEHLDPDLLFKASLGLYITIIGIGLSFDINTQKQIFVLDPDHGKLVRNSVLAIVLYATSAVLLGVCSHDVLWFAVGLGVWHFTGMIFWRATAGQLSRIILDSERSALLRGDFYSFERVSLARQYLRGWWHVPRHMILSLLVIFYVLLAFSGFAQKFAHQLLSQVGASGLEGSLLALVFITYGTIGEGWTWVMRTITRLSMLTLDRLERRYTLLIKPIIETGDRDDLKDVFVG